MASGSYLVFDSAATDTLVLVPQDAGQSETWLVLDGFGVGPSVFVALVGVANNRLAVNGSANNAAALLAQIANSIDVFGAIGNVVETKGVATNRRELRGK